MSDKLRRCISYISHGRGYGHTEAMIKGAENVEGCLVVVANHNQREQLEQRLPKARIITMDELDHMRGLSAPMIIDHFALQCMFEDLEKEHTERIAGLMCQLRKMEEDNKCQLKP